MQRVLIVIISFGLLFLISYSFIERKPTENVIISQSNRLDLKNLFDLTIPKNSIFFLETSFKSFEHEIATINRRASCAVESAALHHPNRSIYYIYVFPNDTESTINIHDKYLKTISTNYINVYVVYAKIDDLVKNTKIEELFGKHLIETSNYFIEHFSDAFRVIILMKFGGIYMDSDVIVLKSMDNLGGNFIGKETEGVLANGVIGFDENGIDLLNVILEDFNAHYDPKSWSGHGPILFTKWVQHMCSATLDYSHNKCNLKILPSNVFYPVSYHIWKHMFDPKYVEEVLKASKNSYLIHFWNKLTHGLILDVKSNAAYLVLAKKHCPKTFSKLNKLF